VVGVRAFFELRAELRDLLRMMADVQSTNAPITGSKLAGSRGLGCGPGTMSTIGTSGQLEDDRSIYQPVEKGRR
jgi:hypothetical protein